MGELFVVRDALTHFHSAHARTVPPTLTRSFSFGSTIPDTIVIKQGSILVYAGVMRMDEKRGDKLIRVPKHTFVAGGGIYIVDPQHVWPVEGDNPFTR